MITTTGSGWVDPGAVDSVEYMTGGDSATVSMQYSYLPSWMSYLVDQERAREAGRALFDAVYDRWSRLPMDNRPRLVVVGESLGSFGGETAFSGEYDLRNRTAGAIFAGPPNFNVAVPRVRRRPGCRQPGGRRRYTVDGRTVRFSNDPQSSIPPADRAWDGTRVLYLQHAVRPDRVVEPPAHRCTGRTGSTSHGATTSSTAMRWIPSGHVLAGQRGPPVRHRSSDRARPRIHPRVRRRMGARPPAARLDAAQCRAPSSDHRTTELISGRGVPTGSDHEPAPASATRPCPMGRPRQRRSSLADPHVADRPRGQHLEPSVATSTHPRRVMPPSRNAESLATARPSVPDALSRTSYWSPNMSFRQADAPVLEPNVGIAVVASPLVMVGSVPGVAGLAPSAAAAVCR